MTGKTENTADIIYMFIILALFVCSGIFMLASYFLFSDLQQYSVYYEQGVKEQSLDIIDFKKDLDNNNIQNYNILFV